MRRLDCGLCNFGWKLYLHWVYVWLEVWFVCLSSFDWKYCNVRSLIWKVQCEFSWEFALCWVSGRFESCCVLSLSLIRSLRRVWCDFDLEVGCISFEFDCKYGLLEVSLWSAVWMLSSVSSIENLVCDYFELDWVVGVRKLWDELGVKFVLSLSWIGRLECVEYELDWQVSFCWVWVWLGVWFVLSVSLVGSLVCA